MNALKIGLDWYKDSKGYDIDRSGHRATIVGNGGKLAPTRPLENEFVFSAFSKVQTDGELLDFVNNYGFLNHPAYGSSVETRRGVSQVFSDSFKVHQDGRLAYRKSRSAEGEDVREHLETARLFRDILRQSSRGWKRVSLSLAVKINNRLSQETLGDITLTEDTTRGFRMIFTTDSLLNGMWLQLAQKVSGQAKFQFCEFCGVPFEVGPDAGRRADATFCSP